MFVIEPVQPGDAGRVAKLAHDALQQAFGADWVDAHLAHRATCLVARDLRLDEVVGLAVTEPHGACEAELIALAVDRTSRGQGVGRALLRGVEDQLVREGALRLSLEVRADDVGAQHFYHRHGFRPEGLASDAYPDGESAIHMARPLR